MSQASPQGAATAVAPAPGAPTAAAGPPAVVGAPAGTPAARSRIRDTPQRLRLLTVEVIIAGLVVGLVGALTLAYLAFSLNRAEADAAQLIRVQKIQTNLLSADATATNAFLVGGLEPPAQRAAYDQAMLAASTLIAEAAQAQPADTEALSVLNRQLVSYAASIEQARANNRQGLPIGAQYLRAASTQLRGTAIPVLDNLVQSNAERAADEMDVRIGYLAVAVALLGLAAVILIQVWVARRFRRRINLGLLLSSIVLLLTVVIGLIGMVQLNSSVKSIKDGSFTALNVAAAARIDANNAKSNESLTLIARGSGQSFETAWSEAAESVSTNLSYLVDQPDLQTKWQAYTDVHGAIRKLDDGGSWDAAVARATGTGDDSSNTTFGSFDAGLASYLEQVSETTSASLSERQPALVIGSILIFLAGLAAALLGRWGLAARLKEYR